MGKLPYGSPDKHVLKSAGGDSDLMKFYCTQNQTTYGRKWVKFEPRPGRHVGTGYLSNFRPGVYYSARLDEVDNPTMGHIVSDNYHSVTEKSFRPYTGPDGKEPLPNTVKHDGSGFIRDKPLHIPTYDELRHVSLCARVASAPADILPRHKPILHHIQRKDPVELENCGYGPKCMSTETSERFRGEQPDRSDVGCLSVGPNSETGFTHNHNVEPLSFHADYAYMGDAPACLTPRPTGVSITKTHFLPSAFATGMEELPRIANRSDPANGFTRGTKPRPEFLNRVPGDAYDLAEDQPALRLDRTRKRDPAEYINMMHPNNYSSMTKNMYLGKQLPDCTEADRLAKTSIGKKEETGYTENNVRHTWQRDNPARFITHNQATYLDRTPMGADREGHTWGGVHRQKEDGFTKSTQLHTNGVDYDTTAILRNLEPYVGRSIRARDTFFDDHTHDSKSLQPATTMYA